jgi:hypothetical protein
MASLGSAGGTFYFVAVLELLSAVLFLAPASPRFGLLLVSSYLGGCNRGAFSSASFFTGGPFLVYMAIHPFVGALVPSTVLAAGWIGTWLSQSQAANPVNRQVQNAAEQLHSVTRAASLGPAS